MLWETNIRCQLKYLRKKCVFNLRLKTYKAFKLRRSVGKLFHNLGAVTLKARSPRHNLEGRKFYVNTDHKPLTYVMNSTTER